MTTVHIEVSDRWARDLSGREVFDAALYGRILARRAELPERYGPVIRPGVLPTLARST